MHVFAKSNATKQEVQEATRRAARQAQAGNRSSRKFASRPIPSRSRRRNPPRDTPPDKKSGTRRRSPTPAAKVSSAAAPRLGRPRPAVARPWTGENYQLGSRLQLGHSCGECTRALKSNPIQVSARKNHICIWKRCGRYTGFRLSGSASVVRRASRPNLCFTPVTPAPHPC